MTMVLMVMTIVLMVMTIVLIFMTIVLMVMTIVLINLILIRGSNTKILTLWIKFMNFQKLKIRLFEALSNITEAFIVITNIL
jgi:hypothetical protein